MPKYRPPATYTDPKALASERRSQQFAEASERRRRELEAWLASPEYAAIREREAEETRRKLEEKAKHEAWVKASENVQQNPPPAGTILEGDFIIHEYEDEKHPTSWQLRLKFVCPEYPNPSYWKVSNDRYGLRMFLVRRQIAEAGSRKKNDYSWTLGVKRIRIMGYGEKSGTFEVLEWENEDSTDSTKKPNEKATPSSDQTSSEPQASVS